MKTASGIEVNVVDQIQVNGKAFFLADIGSKYINGVLVKYIVCPVAQFDRNVPDKVDVVV